MEINILVLNKSESEVLLDILNTENISKSMVMETNNRYRLELDDTEAENIFEKIQEKLTTEGFNLSYNTTEKGTILEDLIDKFNEIDW